MSIRQRLVMRHRPMSERHMERAPQETGLARDFHLETGSAYLLRTVVITYSALTIQNQDNTQAVFSLESLDDNQTQRSSPHDRP